MESGAEKYLLEAQDLGTELMAEDVPPEEIGELHEGAIRRLAEQYPDLTLQEAADPISLILMEMLLSYGVAFRERQEAERSAQEERNRLYAAMEQAEESVLITDVNGVIVYVNSAFSRSTGYCQHEVLGRTPRILKSGYHEEAFYRHLWQTLRAGKSWTGRFLNCRKDGSTFHEDATITPVRDASDEICNYVAVKRDVTQEIQMEERLRQAQKMEAVGRLAGGVAHDFNNLLTGIIGTLGLIRMEAGNSPEVVGYLDDIARNASRAADVTSQLLTFSEQSIIKPEPVDLAAAIGSARRLLVHLLGDDIELVVDAPAGIWQIMADRQRFEQIIVNMAMNSWDAMPGGGVISIEAENTVMDEGDTLADLMAGRYVHISFTDTGHGMDEETRARLFEPFFSTKEKRGLGLGLATVYGIVKQAAGHIEVTSSPGEGTRFDIYWPAAEEEPAVVHAAPGQVGGTETILFVEDEESILIPTSVLLQRHGYTVMESISAEAALKMVESAEEDVDLLLTDVILPGMNGRELALEMISRRPDLPVIYTSGYTDDVIEQRGVSNAEIVFLRKPYTIDELLQLIRASLDAA